MTNYKFHLQPAELSCQSVREYLTANVRGSAPLNLSKDIESHLLRCNACRIFYAECRLAAQPDRILADRILADRILANRIQTERIQEKKEGELDENTRERIYSGLVKKLGFNLTIAGKKYSAFDD
jgi:hypothetical protein